MKKTIGAIALVLAVFSMLYLSNTALASKAAYVVGPANQTVDVSLGVNALFDLDDINSQSSVRIEFRILPGGTFATVTGLGNITSTGEYSRTAQQMQDQFGNGTGEWKVVSNVQFNNESSTKSLTIQD